MSDLGEEVKKILLAGVGAVAITAEKSKEMLDGLVQKGELTVEQGKVLNEELGLLSSDMAGKLFGIPALGAVGFLIAMILGSILIYGILRKKKEKGVVDKARGSTPFNKTCLILLHLKI